MFAVLLRVSDEVAVSCSLNPALAFCATQNRTARMRYFVLVRRPVIARPVTVASVLLTLVNCAARSQLADPYMSALVRPVLSTVIAPAASDAAPDDRMYALQVCAVAAVPMPIPPTVPS